ncbi:hypothetical protein TUM17576_48880 [Enterobacter hormaechei]|nr:hypothetical protein TUM17576_48880 [Enterobacter hormaechei]
MIVNLPLLVIETGNVFSTDISARDGHRASRSKFKPQIRKNEYRERERLREKDIVDNPSALLFFIIKTMTNKLRPLRYYKCHSYTIG